MATATAISDPQLPATLAHLIEVSLDIHASRCDRHRNRPQTLPGVAILNAMDGRLVCRLCGDESRVAAFPFDPRKTQLMRRDDLGTYDRWACAVLKAMDAFYLRHRVSCVGPVVPARVVALETVDGKAGFQPGMATIGEKYLAYPLTIRPYLWLDTDGQGQTRRDSILLDHASPGGAGWLPVELLRIEES